MMKKVLLSGLFGGACFVAGFIVTNYLDIRNGHRLVKDMLTGDKKTSDLSYTEWADVWKYMDYAKWKANHTDANGDFIHD